MPTYKANVVVHVDESLSAKQLHDMEEGLSYLSGVFNTCVREKTPHLFVVDYNPRTIDSRALLGYLNSSGLHAQLIGGI
jgi:hypothetical protein